MSHDILDDLANIYTKENFHEYKHTIQTESPAPQHFHFISLDLT